MQASKVIAIPFNMVESRAGLVGLDAYFWPLIVERHRIAFLVKPADKLSGVVHRSATPLSTRIHVAEQLREVSILRGELDERIEDDIRALRRRALAAALTYPFIAGTDPEIGERYIARYILSKLLEGARPSGRRMWLHLTITHSGGGISLSDKTYSWLLKKEKRVKETIYTRLLR